MDGGLIKEGGGGEVDGMKDQKRKEGRGSRPKFEFESERTFWV